MRYTSRVNGTSNADCPFFINEYAERVNGKSTVYGITCEGTCDQNCIKVDFSDENEKDEFVTRYCYKYPNDCIVAQALERKYE